MVTLFVSDIPCFSEEVEKFGVVVWLALESLWKCGYVDWDVHFAVWVLGWGSGLTKD